MMRGTMKKYFITGLVILLPLVITIAIVGFIIKVLTNPFMGMISSVLSHLHIIDKGFLFLKPEQLIRVTSQLLILVLLFLVTVGLGIIARWFFINSLMKLGDKILRRIPLVNTVYKTTQDIIQTLFVSDKKSLKQVVMIPFPQPGIYAMGLISRDAPKVCCEKTNADLISVLIPTTPNPTTGFLLMYPKEQLIYLDIKPEEAIKYIVSCGVIIPEHPSKAL